MCNTDYRGVLPVFEKFYSLQGEGHNVGMPAYFIRLAGCNVGCPFCDEKKAWSINNAELTEIESLLSEIKSSNAKNVVVTGGEPTMYDLTELTDLMHKAGLKTFLETSGVNQITGSWDWITLSPKQNRLPLPSAFDKANELKVVIAQEEDFDFAKQMKAITDKISDDKEYYMQPEFSQIDSVLPVIVDYIKRNPDWKLSLQTHKMIHIK